MKHLFYIHSAITYLVAIRLIEYNKLNKRDCVFLLGRGFKPILSREINSVELPFTHHPVNSFAVKRKFWESWGKLSGFDAFVHKLTAGEQFHLYTNQTGIAFIQLFMSHSGCAGYSFLEEGVASYYTQSKINNEICPSGSATTFYKVLKYLNFFGRLSDFPQFFSEDYTAVYGISNESFSEFRNRVILDDVLVQGSLASDVEGYVLALDALYEYGSVSKEEFAQALREMFSYFKRKGIGSIRIKYHPEQYANPVFLAAIRSLIEKYRGDVRVTELDPDCILELVAANKANDVTFYVFLSSVGLYAGLCGRKVYSFAHFIGERCSNYKARIENLPPVYKKYVEFL